jgi:predicted TIM-barrel fold metal-dependent hydrolase
VDVGGDAMRNRERGARFMSRTYQVISGDGHLEIPPNPWIRHVPDEFRDRAPRLVALREGGHGWIVEGSPLIHNGQNVAAGRPVKVRGGSYWDPDGTPVPGTGDAVQRLREQDQDGLDAEVLFPPVFISRFIENIEDREAYVAMVRAYNDFLVQDYCSVAPDRLLGNALIPSSGLEDAMAELKRVKELGARSVYLSSFPTGTAEPSPEDDVFWHAALELGTPIALHAALGARGNPLLAESARGRFTIEWSMLSRTNNPSIVAIVRMILHGVLDRIPELQLYFAESNASWLPSALSMVDDSYAIFKDWYGVDLALAPSEYTWRNFHFGIVRDPLALRMKDLLDLDRIMWGSDFPHSVGSFPESSRWVDEIFAPCTAEERRKVLVENPCRFFGLDPDAALTPTP